MGVSLFARSLKHLQHTFSAYVCFVLPIIGHALFFQRELVKEVLSYDTPVLYQRHARFVDFTRCVFYHFLVHCNSLNERVKLGEW